MRVLEYVPLDDEKLNNNVPLKYKYRFVILLTATLDVKIGHSLALVKTNKWNKILLPGTLQKPWNYKRKQ